MSWLHCNKCGTTAAAGNGTDFFCGSCRHTLCGTCSESKLCPIDQKPFRGVKIDQSMPDNLRHYFEDPSKLLATWQKVVRFQFEQRTLCEELEYEKNLKQIRQYKAEIDLLVKTKGLFTEAIEKDVKQINKMKAYVRTCYQNRADSPDSSEISRDSTEPTMSSLFAESGVDLEFDESNSNK